MSQLDVLAQQVIDAVKSYVANSARDLSVRLNNLELRLNQIPSGAKGEPGEIGPAGKDAPPLSADDVALALAQLIPVPKDGEKGESGDKGVDGVDGKDAIVDPEELADVAEKAVERFLLGFPMPKDGEKGDRGEDGVSPPPVDVDAVAAGITAHVLEQIPVPKDGVDGKDGIDAKGDPGEKGEKGDKGDAGETLPVSIEIVDDIIARTVANVQVINGDKGDKGDAGEKGDRGDAGPMPEIDFDAIAVQAAALVIPVRGDKGDRGDAGERGADGKGVTAEDFRQLFEAECAKWLLEYERRANDRVEEFLKSIPKPKDGADGLGFDDMEVVHDGERSVTLRFVRGDVVKEFSFTIPSLIERGIFKAGDEYERGDGVTYNGSFWIAQCDTKEKPGDGKTWRLSVKRGTNGKDGDRGPAGPKGDPGANGRDLTQMGPDGRKW